MKHTVAPIAIALAALALPARATSIAQTSLGKLVSGADWIVIAKVLRVVDVPTGEGEDAPAVCVAEVEVLRCIKGLPRPERIWYLAEGVAEADYSDAVVGETALLFLNNQVIPGGYDPDDFYPRLRSVAFRRNMRALTGGPPLRQVCWAGVGRMPLDEVGDVRYALCDEWLVHLPPDLATIPGPNPRLFDVERRVPLDAVLDFAKRRLAPLPEKAAPFRELLDELDRDPDPWPSRRRYDDLQARGERMIPMLLALLDDPGFPRRDTLAEALFWIGYPGIEAVHEALKSKSLVRRRAAAFALEWFARAELADNSEVMPEALEAAEHPGPDEELRARVLGALASALSSDEKEEATDALLPALRDDSLRVRRGAARTLLQIAGPLRDELDPAKVEPALLVLVEHEDVGFRREVWEVLACVAGPKAMPAVLRALDDSDRVVRVLATFALRRIRADAATKRLIELLASKDAWIRRTAAFALGEAKAAAAVGPLTKALADPDVGVVRSATDALGEIGPAAAAAVPALEKLHETTDNPYLRSDVEDALEEIRK
jgi:HEAT repeat protein